MVKTIFEKSQIDHHGYSLPKNEMEFKGFRPLEQLVRKSSIPLPEISELDLMRHFSELASKNVGVDNLFYPLGSCTMKLNPRINEYAAALKEFTASHPLAPQETVQGNLQIMWELLQELCQICGMDGGSLAPNAGAQGEYVGISLIKAYHESNGQLQRDEILIPDSAHGTNPASAAMAGYKTLSVRTNQKGELDIEDLRSKVSDKTAGLMLTNPNTLGIFETAILEIAEIIHNKGGLLYYDGANLNPLLYIARPGDMGFDALHLNLHKTFSTPHGGGGPGAGPILCKQKLLPFLPVPRIHLKDNRFFVHWDDPKSIGQISTFFGNFSIFVRAYLYIKLHGKTGLRRVAEIAVLNANYLKTHLKDFFHVPFQNTPCMHEFAAQADRFEDKGIRAIDIAKRILDFGMYAPTIYFPLMIKECLLIEPTETESKQTLDYFINAFKQIVEEIVVDPEILRSSPHTKSVSRLNETLAARNPVLKDPSLH